MHPRWPTIALIGAGLLAACAGPEQTATPTTGPTPTPPPTQLATATPFLAPTSTPGPILGTPTPPPGLPAPSPSPTPETPLVVAPPPAAPLYTADFADGLAEGWSLNEAWRVSQRAGDFVLHGKGEGFATFTQGAAWADYALKFRIRVRAGGVYINYRQTDAARTSRYLFFFTGYGLSNLPKQVDGAFTNLAGSALSGFNLPNTWYTVEIRGFEGHLQVLVDGVIEMDLVDATPIPQGTIGFEMIPNSEVFVDDIEVLPLTGPLPSAPPPSAVISRPSVLDYVDRPPPIASLITIGTPGPDGVTLVTGNPGSVPPSALVTVATVEYAEVATVRAAADGGFSALVHSAPGATIQVRYDPYGTGRLNDRDPAFRKPWPGTLIRVADSLGGGGGTPFSGAGAVETGDGDRQGAVLWAVEGTVVERKLDPGEAVAVSGTLRVYIPAGVTAPPSLNVFLSLGIDPMFDAGGGQLAAGSNFVSRILTPTGLPIERDAGPVFARAQFHEFELSLQNETEALVASFDATLSLPPSLPPGTHRLYLWLQSDPELDRLLVEGPHSISTLLGHSGATVALFSVGTPEAPRLSPALLVDSPNQGVRGTIAMEERGRYELADRTATQLDGFVVEPRDLATGQLIPYRLEPFFPFISNADRFLSSAPLVPLDLPGGSLNVTVHTPSGGTDELGTHPILQTRTGEAATVRGEMLNIGGGHPGDVLQLTTLSNDLVYRFAEYGRYTVTLSGSVPDIWGREYPFTGTYEVWVAETLDVETASLPSTPFQVGDRLPAVVSVYPGVPARVEMSFELHPIDGSAVVADSVVGTANRFGYFDGAGKAFEMTEAGEYLVSLRASYTDAEGRLWMGARRWGSGVASASPVLIAHGRRGDDALPVSEQRAWFSRSPVGIFDAANHISFPYHSGDMVWATEDDAVQMRVTVQDLEGRIADLLEERAFQSSYEGPGVPQRRVTGDLPLILSTSDGLDAAFAPAAIDQWGYAYRAVQRPGVRVRESIGTDGGKSPYWRFADQYLAQRGMGVEGDRTNDIKWMFGAAVFKRPDLGIGEVAIYGSLWVQINSEDPVGSRVFPPFQGAAGGPSGGPIMTLKGQEIDLFLMPTAVRPGTVLEIGDRFVFAGQIGPPLASKVAVRVTSPSGRVRTVNGQANSIGYFSDPAGDFVVDEPGVWTVDVEVLHDGMTSAGPVEPPYPTGGVLGSADGRFRVYVVPKATARIDFGLPDFSLYALRVSRFEEVPAQLRFFPRIPGGWRDVAGVYTISMPGFILEEGTLEPGQEVLEVVYDPFGLQRDFPNIDLTARGRAGAGLSDEVFISVLLSGTDASGQRVHAAKVLTLVGEDIYDLN